MKTFTCRSISCRIIGTALVIFLLLGQAAYGTTQNDEANLLYLEGILNLIRDQYKGDISDDKLVNGAVSGIFQSLDDYTTYYNNEEKEKFMDSVTGVFGGIGVTIEMNEEYIIVSKVLASSPAEKSGIRQGDKIVEANGVSLIKATTDKAVSTLKGEPGTKVKIGILRNGSNSIKYFEITREIIKVNPVSYEIRNGIGYIKLEIFNENTEEYITKALEVMDKNNITKIILDLRDNPGGEVSQSVAVAKKFVPKGLITKLDYQSTRYSDLEYNSVLEHPKYKLAVLVNGMSASASEIVSGAIQDTGAGKLIGTKTFGKAKFQSLIPILTMEAFVKYKNEIGVSIVNAYDLQYFGVFPSKDEIGGYTKMTLGVYYTPKGRMIDGEGLLPDIIVEDPKLVSEISINNIQRLTKTVAPGLNSQGIDVYNAEKILKILNYGIKIPDSTLDSDTAAELKAYQKKNNLRQNGILDFATQDTLNEDLLKLVAKYDLQYSAAVNSLN